MTIRRRYIILILGLIIMAAGVGMAAYTQNGFGTVAVTEVDFQAVDGSNIHATLQRPTYATSTNTLPGVVVIHGIMQSKEWLMAFGIELARRGFVVLTIDANGHGNSDPGTGSGAAALDYITSLDFVDSSQIGLIGHSMGGSISWSAIADSSVYVRALVLVGAGFSSSAPYTPNTLIAVGSFDSLSSYPSNFTKLDPYFNVTGVVPNTTYGNFTDNTARRAIFPPTNHLFETIDPTIVSESVDWMRMSLKGGVEDIHWIDSTHQIFSVWLIGGLFALLGALLTLFPFIVMLLSLPIFVSLRKTPPQDNTGSMGSILKYGTLYGLIGIITFFPFLIIGSLLQAVTHFPVSNGLPVMAWMIGSGLVAAGALHIILKRKPDLHLSVRLLLKSGGEKAVPTLLRTLALTIVVFLWLYGLTLLVDLGLALDLRSFLPGLNDLTLLQAAFVPLYFLAFLVYTLVEGAWFTSILLPKSSGSWLRVQLEWSAMAVFIKCLPYLILIAFEFVGGLILGAPILPSMIGFSWLFFYAFTPWFAVCIVITLFTYRGTGSRWLGAIINAILCAWLLATILPYF
ncbi:MAG: alpha/beta fold hydrolase [Candidatus Thorarchaeota archaeon]|nr:alpha/beta fold hydrolase [Candidatus Thorarchaeota archaeon]